MEHPMDKNDHFLYDPNYFAKIQLVAQELEDIIKNDMGVRLGQSSVCSQKMHTFYPKKPEEVKILQDIDAGQTFYHRKEVGSIYHIDVFHECGLVDHRIAAQKVYTAVECYNLHYSQYIERGNSTYVDVNYFDIQTGTGGGRITGSLNYGKKMSLRKGHTNHVHVAMSLPENHLASIMYVIMAVESAIIACKLELRRNEKIENVKGSSRVKMDLSAYADKSDSLLQRNHSTMIPEPYQKNQDTMDLMENFDTAQELKEFLAAIDNNHNSKPHGGVNSRRAVECLVKKGIIELNGNSATLTKYGKQFKNYLEKHLPEIETHLRQVVRDAKYLFTQNGKSKALQNKVGWHIGEKLMHHIKASHEHGQLAISETVHAVAQRMAETGETEFNITATDIRYSVNPKKRKIEFCVMIDASSSMEGQRIRAAKRLARFLFFSTADPISVLVFQENKAWVQVPFTRDLSSLEDGLEKIKASGETPLALGLTACLEYLTKEKVRNPLIILITDGVPTLGIMTSDPVHDALQVAKKIKGKHYGFTCIGLKPHLDYLKQLSNIAGGSIYAVDELEKAGMC